MVIPRSPRWNVCHAEVEALERGESYEGSDVADPCAPEVGARDARLDHTIDCSALFLSPPWLDCKRSRRFREIGGWAEGDAGIRQRSASGGARHKPGNLNREVRVHGGPRPM